MSLVSIDLGTTNMKVQAYDHSFKKLWSTSRAVEYARAGKFVEFDAELYFDTLAGMLHELSQAGVIAQGEKCYITLTGQAESLVVLDKNMKPLMNAISWMDERSQEECEYISTLVTEEECYQVTGQCAVLPTWPATKILWLKKNRPEVYDNAHQYVLIKDYIAYRLSGKLFCECSIATFSFYFDIRNRCYWKKMLDIIGINESQLPEFVEPGTDLGALCEEAAEKTGLANATVNVGTLDHFAGMIGTGNIKPGIVTESTGTVMAMSIMADLPIDPNETAALHYGPFPGTYVFLPVCESGGISLGWFRDRFLPGVEFDEINKVLGERGLCGELLFLPYINGTNAPEFDAKASGLFMGLKTRHDAYDMAGAVMEGVALILDRILQTLANKPVSIISTGGGAKSPLWLQMKADITGIEVKVPEDKEAALLGTAIMGAVNAKLYDSYEAAVETGVRMEKVYQPRPYNDQKKKAYSIMYDAMIQAQY